MAYTRLNLSDGQVFNASHVSHIEDGIEDCETQISEVNQSLTDYTVKNLRTQAVEASIESIASGSTSGLFNIDVTPSNSAYTNIGPLTFNTQSSNLVVVRAWMYDTNTLRLEIRNIGSSASSAMSDFRTYMLQKS